SQALINCEIYFSNLQRSSIEANLSSFNTVTKEELGIYSDRIISEFQRRTLAKFLAKPANTSSTFKSFRRSNLNQQKVDRPWIDLFGRNYVETLHCICNEQSALHQLKNFIQEDIMKDEEEPEASVEIEFSLEELEFFNLNEHRVIKEMVLFEIRFIIAYYLYLYLQNVNAIIWIFLSFRAFILSLSTFFFPCCNVSQTTYVVSHFIFRGRLCNSFFTN
ncbi:hypothetical protein OESDEN_18078, partial [Oesophagostomum dentatum]